MAKAINAAVNYEFNILHLFAGMGGGALGFKHARYAYKGITGRFRNILGIDVDERACKDYERLTASPVKVMDLFSEEQYIAFHGNLPPNGWQEASAEDILEVAEGEYPDVVCASPPCKGLSALLPQRSADSAKYQALNRLVVRGISLTLDAFRRIKQIPQRRYIMQLKKLIKVCNGLEITWRSVKGLELPALILTSNGRNASIKPLDSSAVVKKKVEKAWGRGFKPIIPYDDPKFCLSAFSMMDAFGKARLEEILKYKVYEVNAEYAGETPVCPYV